MMNLILDLCADDLNDLADGAAISSWTDRVSGIGFTASGSARPTLKKSWINGKSYVQFDGVANLLTSTSFLDSSYDTAFTLVIARDYHGVEIAANNLNIFVCNKGVSNSWLGQYDRANSIITLGNVASGYQMPVTDGPAVESLGYDGTTITHRQNGVTRTSGHAGTLGLTGKLTIGGFESGSFFQAGYLRRLLLFKESLPATSLALFEQSLFADAGMSDRILNYFLGDSQTYGLTATLANSYPAYTSHAIGTTQNYTVNGVSSRLLADMYANYANEIRPALYSGMLNRVVVRAGTNDMYAGGTGANTYNNYFVPLCQKLRADGAKIVAVTCMKRSGFVTPPGFEAERLAYNALIVGTPSLYDALVDVGNSSLYPMFADSTDATYFNDQVHNTDLGNSIVANGYGSDSGVVGALNSLPAETSSSSSLTVEEIVAAIESAIIPVNVVQVNGAADAAASIGAANILKVVLHDSTTAHVYFDRPVVAAATGSPNSNFRIDGNAPDAVTAQSQTIITLNYTGPSNGPISIGNVWVLASQPNWLTTAVNMPDQGVVVADEVGDLLAFAVPGGYASGTAGYELGRLATIAGSTALISTGGNTFRSPIQNGTIHIPQGMNWTNNTLAAIQILQDGGNWPDLSEYPAAGSNGIFLELSIRPQYTNVAGYNPTNSASFSFACTASGTSPDQIISIRPGTPTTNLQPRNDAGDGPNGPPYTAQVWAINGSDEVLLFSGLADVVDNIRS